MEKIILENRFSTHQKITFLIYIGGPFLIGVVALLNMNLNFKDYFILVVLLVIYSFIFSVAFLKRGFLKIDSNLYKGSFFRGKLFFKKKIDISQRPKISVLKLRKSQKLAWFSAAKPDLSTEFDTFEINILNEKHTKREAIMDLNEKNNVDKTISFLTSNFNLKNELYSPNFK